MDKERLFLGMKESFRNNYFIGAIVFLVSFSVYFITLCPTVYWGDSGGIDNSCLYFRFKNKEIFL